MTQQKRCSFPLVHMRKPKRVETTLPSFSKARLEKLIEEAVVDAYGEEEQMAGFLTMMQEHLALPFQVNILGVDADVVDIDFTLDAK